MKNAIEISKKEALAQIAESKGLDELIKPLTREVHLFDTFIAGTTYLKDKEVLTETKEGDKLALRREGDNKFDDNAILVLTAEGKKVGYIPEMDNVIFARLMDAGKMLMAKVTGIKEKGSFTQIGIGIYLVDF